MTWSLNGSGFVEWIRSRAIKYRFAGELAKGFNLFAVSTT